VEETIELGVLGRLLAIRDLQTVRLKKKKHRVIKPSFFDRLSDDGGA